jgi:hypothetical protein
MTCLVDGVDDAADQYATFRSVRARTAGSAAWTAAAQEAS